jgi:High potential iron-sulfur protein
MTAKIKTYEFSRRSLLQGAACGVGAATVLAMTMTAARAGKMPQSTVAYQGSPKDGKSCANCRLFQAPSTCKSVEGAVRANGWCRIWFKA